MTKYVEMDFVAPITTRIADRDADVLKSESVPVYWESLGDPIGKATNIRHSPDGKSVVADIAITAEQAERIHASSMRQFSMGAVLESVICPKLSPEERAKLKEEFRREWEGGEKSEIRLMPGLPWPRFETPPADPNAVIHIKVPCQDCNGSGQYVGLNEVETCRTCNGKKVVTP